MQEKWGTVYRVKARFLKKYDEWLQEEVDFSQFVHKRNLSFVTGRPPKDFVECTEKVKKRKAKKLSDNVGPDIIYI